MVWHTAQCLARPVHDDLRAGNLAGGQVGLQLVGKAQLTARCGMAQARFDSQFAQRCSPGFGGEDRDLLTGGWNAHACRLGGFQQFAGGLCIGRKARHTHAPARNNFGRAQALGLGHGLHYRAGVAVALGVERAAFGAQQNCKFTAVQARHDVAGLGQRVKA